MRLIHLAIILACLLYCWLPVLAEGEAPGGDKGTTEAVPSRTLMEHLQAAKAPVFQQGNTLPPLTRWGWSMPYDVRVELSEKWGYALEFGGYVTDAVVDEVEQKPDSINARIVKLAAADPKRYPLCVLTHRPLGDPEKMPTELLDAYYLKDGKGQPIPDADPKIGKPSWRTISPLAPDAIFAWAAQGTVAPLVRLSKLAPLAVILNGGEYGLTVGGHSSKYLEQDPAVVAARGDRSWFTLISEQKARQEAIITEAVRKAFPKRSLYLWYHFGGIPTWDGDAWSLGPQMLKVSDYPDQSLYYKHYNSGWDGKNDLLTNYTYAVAQAIPLEQPLSFNWVSGGWTKDATTDLSHYMGFLKCLYAAGQLGAVAGYFSFPQGLDGKPVGPEPTPCLQQMMALGHVHALFSHVEEFLRQGDLLPGPLHHVRDQKLPAYEFGTPADGTRIFVRKQRVKDAWLIVAWTASGDARDAAITVPDLGQFTVRARPEGSVYLATKKDSVAYEPPVVSLELLDQDGMDPTARWRKAEK